jgi:hypothetical protein
MGKTAAAILSPILATLLAGAAPPPTPVPTVFPKPDAKGTPKNEGFSLTKGESVHGGPGDDTYFVTTGTPVEQPGEGTDMVIAYRSARITDFPNIENLAIDGSSVAGIGSDGSEGLYGRGPGPVYLDGRGGEDVLDLGPATGTYIVGSGIKHIGSMIQGQYVRLHGSSITSFDEILARTTDQPEGATLVDGERTLIFKGLKKADLKAKMFDLPITLGNMVETFDEDFSGGISPKRWKFGFRSADVINRLQWGNKEKQIYFDGKFLKLGVDPFTVKDGILSITAQPIQPEVKDAVVKAAVAFPFKDAIAAIRDAGYTSGMLQSQGLFQQTYGYFEIRTKLPAGKGIVPGFWLMPADGSWPPEIAPLEQFGNTLVTTQTLHSKADGQNSEQHRVTIGIDGGSDFHTYGVMWKPDTISFYIDRIPTAEFATPADMHKPFYLLLTLAVGGWSGAPDASTTFPATMEVDYIRAWQFPDQMKKGRKRRR